MKDIGYVLIPIGQHGFDIAFEQLHSHPNLFKRPLRMTHHYQQILLRDLPGYSR